MTITVKHTKVSAIPDAGDANLVQPSDWNADHTLIGLGTMAEQNANNVAITGGAISGVTIPASNVTGTLQVNQGGTGATTLTGYVKGTGTTAMTASATIPNTDITGLGTASIRDAGTANGVATLDAGGKVPVSELPAAVLGALNYQGTWNASTNTPTLTSSVGTKGYYYVVSVAGSTNLDGITDWLVGDWAVYNGTVWQKVDNTETVTSVNGQTGAVTLTTTNIAEGTNEYFTQSRARQSLAAGTGISYDNTTGVITNSSPSLGGDVVGPASATDNAITRFDTTTGKLIQNSTVTLDDNGNVINANSIGLDTTPATIPATVGTMFWDTGNKAPSINLENGVELQLGQENVVLVYNNTGSTITNGQVVAVNGAQGQRPAVVLADADSEPLSASTLGIATENIASGAEGFVTTFGVIRGIDTSGFTAGNPVYLSSTAGQFTATRPSAPAHTVFLGWIIKVNASSGELFVNISNGWELDELHNVLISSPTGGNLLAYDQTNQYWKNINLTDGTAISITETTGGAITIANTGVTQATAGTGISVSAGTGNVTITNTAPDQTVVLTAGTGISTSGTYPNFTITNTSPSSGGTVTSIDTGTGLTGGPITSTGTISLANTAVTPASYTNANITVDAQGRITSASNGTSSSGTVTSVAATVPSFLSVSGSPITTSGTLALTYSGTPLPVANGGTAQSTYTTGDILYASASNTLSKLAVGSTGQVLNVTSGVPSWTPNLVVASNIVDTSANTGSLNIPQGTTAERPATPAAGAFRYNSTTAEVEVYLGTWQTIAFSPYSVSFLVIGGGGGGGYGSNAGGGGGAGGYRNSVAGESSGGGASAESDISVIPQTSYTVTIGAGGAGAATTSVAGTSGNNSVFSTITSVGGGGGGSGTGSTPTGVSGGCGGGGGTIGNSTTYAGGSGTTNQGYAGGSGRHVPGSFEGAGGGGGAASVGANSSGGTGGVGGTALSSSINGSSVARAGGGGGGGNTPSAGGGGGAGAGTGVSATANTGSGGGGNAGVGGNGGSGIVIIRYAGAQRGTGGTVTSSGGYTIHTFTSSGTYIA